MLYVTNAGPGIEGDQTRDSGTVSVIATASKTVVATVDLGG